MPSFPAGKEFRQKRKKILTSFFTNNRKMKVGPNFLTIFVGEELFYFDMGH